MLNVREPILHPVEIVTLRPTQITVGMREVNEKRKQWRKNPDATKSELLGRHMIPVIFGPKDRYYVIDHHHLARALHDEGEKQVAQPFALRSSWCSLVRLQCIPQPDSTLHLSTRSRFLP